MDTSFLLRFKRASIRELLYRGIHMIENAWFRRLIEHGKNPLKNREWKFLDITNIVPPSLYGDISNITVSKILEGNNDCLNADRDSIAAFEREYQHTFFKDVGNQSDLDIRSVWEPARLQNIATLLHLASKHPDTEEGRQAKLRALDDSINWILRNRFLCGPHYMSAMECGLRILPFFLCLRTTEQGSKDYTQIAQAIYEHAWWINRRLSLYASLGNHTVCESIGLVIAGTIFKDLKEGKQWLKRAVQLLETELFHQVLPDGGPAEQSFSYHRFILDLYQLIIDFIEANSLSDCTHWKGRIEKGESFLATVPSSSLPSVGDSDGGHAISPYLTPKRIPIKSSNHTVSTYPDSGYTIVQLDSDGYLVFDHGPLGMSPLYNHGHADALSITIRKEGHDIFVDPGTYRYNGVPEWRKYFKGTSAHNTVTVDGIDQAIQETGFIWSSPYNAELLRTDVSSDGKIIIEGIHTGYERLEKPVIHRRVIDISHKGKRIEIRDSFAGNGVHYFTIHYHFHPKVELIKKNDKWLAIHDDVSASIQIEGGEQYSLRGSNEPLMGWYSPEYGMITETWTLSARQRSESNKQTFLTVVEFD